MIPGPFAGQEDEFALYDEKGNKVETSTSKEDASGELSIANLSFRYFVE